MFQYSCHQFEEQILFISQFWYKWCKIWSAFFSGSNSALLITFNQTGLILLICSSSRLSTLHLKFVHVIKNKGAKLAISLKTTTFVMHIYIYGKFHVQTLPTVQNCKSSSKSRSILYIQLQGVPTKQNANNALNLNILIQSGVNMVNKLSDTANPIYFGCEMTEL